ncbi:MAG TPA: hypothetical protein VFF50_02765 [Candidatus Deferrimicrobiaceae bacterium]|nr:hypothetical protein [Candidatus Deferrimicrobiaceae bacterium]
MRLKPFLLDMWLDKYEHDIEFNLASSEGPGWTVNELLNLASEKGILLAPGDCFDSPSHFRLGFAAAGDKFPQALDRLGTLVK